VKFNAEARAGALLASAAAKGRPDFADRAAACHLLLPHQTIGVDFLSLWPGRLEDFAQSLTPEQNRELALALLSA
jgi:hypothetical protein